MTSTSLGAFARQYFSEACSHSIRLNLFCPPGSPMDSQMCLGNGCSFASWCSSGKASVHDMPPAACQMYTCHWECKQLMGITSRLTLFRSTSLPSFTPAMSSLTISAMAFTRACMIMQCISRLQLV